MLHGAPIAVQKAPHVIVVGNEKGGSGKTTIAMHVAVALLKDGQRVGTSKTDASGHNIGESNSKSRPCPSRKLYPRMTIV
jgi:Mrp family chromosome partitioning ATPase